MIEYNIFNINIHSTNHDELCTTFEGVLLSSKNPQLLTTFNLDFLRIALEDSEFLDICKNSLYNLPDGFGITSLIKLKYKTKIERITGNDIFPLLLSLAEKHEQKVAIIGGTEKVSQAVEGKIKIDFSFRKDMLLFIAPPYNFELNKKLNKQIINTISSFAPDIVFVALGCPRQEKWLYNNMNKFGSKINIGIGGTLDFFTGEKKRSPLLFQNIGLEWLWRLSNEPIRLFKRYILKDLPFYFKMIYNIFSKGI